MGEIKMNELKIGKDSSIIDIINYILTVDPYIPIEQLDNSKQTQILYELLDRDDINSEVRKKALLVIWRDSNTEIRKNCTPDVFNKIIEAMKGDAKRLSAIWRVTPESIQLQNESSLTEIMQYSIEDTNRYIDIWKNTAEELKQKHPEIARKIDILEQLETKNSKIYSTINLRILDEKYLSSLDFEQLQAITNYPQEQKRILDLTDNQYHVLIKTLRGVDSLEQWKYEFELVMSNLDGYEDLINSISKMPEENIDFYEVLNVLQQKNYFNIRDYQEMAELDQRKERLYQAAKKGEETPGYDKQFILLEYLFNIDKGQAENLTKKYAQDLPNLENNQENDELKQIISQIQTVLNCNDERSDTRTF